LLAVARFTIVAALLLHLIFGCSLHHAAACERDHGGCHHPGLQAASKALDQQHVCHHGHQHDCSVDDQAVEDEAGPAVLGSEPTTGLSCDCHTQPCHGNHPGCHGEVECSFVPSNDLVFVIDCPLIAFVIDEHNPWVNYVDSLTSRGVPERSARVAADSLSHCATLCTWII